MDTRGQKLLRQNTCLTLLLMAGLPAWLACLDTSPLFAASPAVACTTHYTTVDSRSRNYIKCVPSTLAEPAGLVMLFHPATSSAQGYLDITQWDEIAPDENVIVISLNGCDWDGCNGGYWNTDANVPWGWAEEHRIDDKAFVTRVLDAVRTDYTIDPARIYATGFSNGGILAYTLACDMADTFAAIGVTSGELRDSSCQPSESVAVFHVHGTQDTTVPFYTSDKSIDALRGLDRWAEYNNCEAITEVVSDDGVTLCERYTSCSPGQPVEYCTTPGAAHLYTVLPQFDPTAYYAERFREAVK